MPEDRRKAAHRVDANRFWAVIIGINAYPSCPLRGCMSDVKKMEEFLTKDLGMPEGHIQCLLSPIPIPPDPSDSTRLCIEPEERRIVGGVTSPIRENTVNTLLSLSTNPQILPNDNIVIYFSGHGSSYDLKASGLFKADDISAVGSIGTLCPVDRSASDATDLCIPDISDRELNNILAEISRTKGNHITLILDCCHSSGVSRVPNEPLNVARRAPSLPAD
ncbi:peptidase C14, caspase domain-containing protein [Armillaria nabsnona]|nr:peptidase C14, caspase domain-containing protein [Armillaria nabsnona]